MPVRLTLLALVSLLAVGASAQTDTLLAHHVVSPTAPPDTVPLAATDARAAALLDAWVEGDLAPLVAATAPARRADAWRDFAAARRVMTAAWGDAVGFQVAGTTGAADGTRVTAARLMFADGVETVVLRWAASGALVTMVRATTDGAPAQR